MPSAFRVGITRDYLKSDGSVAFDGPVLRMLDAAPGVEWEFVTENVPQLEPRHVAGLDALVALGARVTRETIQDNDRLAIVARLGVGYDTVDVDACTDNGVMLTITPDGVRRPVASSVMCFLLALSHKLLIKDRITRDGRWFEKLDHMGVGLEGRTLGIVGLGNIGCDVLRLATPFGMKHLGHDPHVDAQRLAGMDVQLVDLPTLISSADFVAICCALTAETRGLIGAELLSQMKPTAFFINVARGPIVDQQALTKALQERRIQGAGLDVFEQEPIDPNDPLLQLDNVILAPHAICWTDQCVDGNGRGACESVLAVAAGKEPACVVNRAVLSSHKLKSKLERFAAKSV